MKNLSLIMLVFGLSIVAYSIINRLTLAPTDTSISMAFLRSSNLMIMANTALLISLIVIHYNRYR